MFCVHLVPDFTARRKVRTLATQHISQDRVPDMLYDYLVSHYGKIRWKTQEEATKACLAMLRKRGEQLTSYSCRYCGGWHTGH